MECVEGVVLNDTLNFYCQVDIKNKKHQDGDTKESIRYTNFKGKIIMSECDKCLKTNAEFHFKQENYAPDDYIEGNNNSLIWIIGLNPRRIDESKNKQRTVEELRKYFQGTQHPYFQKFQSVSPRLYEQLGRQGGVAHTDIVKCASNQFPTGSEANTIVSNCFGYLKNQIIKHKPKILICNGAVVSRNILEFIPPTTNFDKKLDTRYEGVINGNKIQVILSGFVGRIDNYSRRRLGQEIEKVWDEMK